MLPPLALAFLSLLPIQAIDAYQAAPPPNLLVIVADDLGVEAVGSYAEGTDLPSTPSIDALAASGVLFRNAWSNPVCSPTRAVLQTGRYGFRTGIGWLVWSRQGNAALPPGEWTLPEMLDGAPGGAYTHAAFGKWHLGTDAVGGALAPNDAGYGHFAGSLDNLARYDDWGKVTDGVSTRCQRYATSETVDDALAWIGQASEPWFCHVAFNAPHVPFHAPPAALHTVDLSQANPDPNLEPRPYWRAMVEAMDTELGRLLASLPPNTTILFVGDNGSPQQVALAPFSPAKGTLAEGGINVPLLIAGAGVTAAPGSECAALVDTSDVFGTLAELAGVDLATATPPGLTLDSTSLVPYLSDPAQASLRTHVFAEMFWPNGPTVRAAPSRCSATGTQLPSTRPYCYPDAGLNGAGTAELWICNTAGGGNRSLLEVRNAPPNAPGIMLSSNDPGPTFAFGGRLIGFPWVFAKTFTTDAQGRFVVPFAVVPGFAYFYYQAAVEYPTNPGTATVTNAVRVDSLQDRKAVRDARHKLIRDRLTCRDELYDLLLDPYGQNDLLSSGAALSPADATAYRDLGLELDRLLGT